MAPRSAFRPRGDDDGLDDVSNDRRNEIRRELLNMDPAEIPDFLGTLEGQGELQVANEWLVLNGMTPSTSNLADVSTGAPPPDAFERESPIGQLPAPAGSGPASADEAPLSEQLIEEQIQAELDAQVDEQIDEPIRHEAAMDDAIDHVADVVAGAIPGSQLDLEAELEQYDLSPSEVDEVILRGTKKGTEERAREDPEYSSNPELATATAQQEVNSLFLDTDIPIWIRQTAAQLGALDPVTGDLRPEELQQFADYYNLINGTRLSVDQVVKEAMVNPSESNMLIAESALSDVEPTTTMRVSVPQRGQRPRSVEVSEATVGVLQGLGYSLQDINRLTRASEMYGEDHGGTAPGAVDERVWGIGALLRAHGGGASFDDLQNRQDKAAGLKSELARLQAQGGPGAQERIARIAELKREIRAAEGIRKDDAAGVSIFYLQSRQNAGWELYNDGAMAYIHALDARLAGRLSDSGGDPAKMDPDDAQEAYSALVAGGFYEVDPLANPQSIITGQLGDYFAIREARRGGGGGGGGGGAQRRVLDEVGVRDAVTQLWEGMFFEKPNDEFVGAFMKQLQGQLDAAPPGQEFDVSARIKEFAQNSAAYQEFYSKKPEGVSDEDYQSQFLAGAQSMLGAEAMAETGSIKRGMRQGQMQTTIGSIAGTKTAWQNSTFLGRLAEAAQSVSELT